MDCIHTACVLSQILGERHQNAAFPNKLKDIWIEDSIMSTQLWKPVEGVHQMQSNVHTALVPHRKPHN